MTGSLFENVQELVCRLHGLKSMNDINDAEDK